MTTLDKPDRRINDISVFEALEPELWTHRRQFPKVFNRARGAELYTEDGRTFIDFCYGAGGLNYGHNHPHIKRQLAAYLTADGLSHGLDVYTAAEREFLRCFHDVVLEPRELDYKVWFRGSTGDEAVAAATELARNATGRTGVVSFAKPSHDPSTGLADAISVPYPYGPLGPFDSLAVLERVLADGASDTDLPAAVLMEPLQIEGGVYPAPREWLRELRELTTRHGVLLVCDESQAGCGRTGTFFGFEHAGIVPDIVALSTSTSGYGLPMSLILLRPDLERWPPDEHATVFLGNQLAFVTAAAALELWQRTDFRTGLAVAVRRLDRFREEVSRADPAISPRGTGMVLGIDFGAAGGAPRAELIQRRCFAGGLIVGRCGRNGEVVYVMPPLTIDPARHERGLEVLHQAVAATAGNATKESTCDI